MKFRELPAIHELLESEAFLVLLEQYSRAIVRDLLREELDAIRTKIPETAVSDVAPENLAKKVLGKIQDVFSVSLTNVINATGTVLHTNLGRAPLAEEALNAAVKASRGYCNLEFDLDTGLRGHRSDHVKNLLCELSGAEAAFAVNNNAGAVLLALSAIASGSEVIVSRGELIEIGGGFRVPDVMAATGAILKEVGTTNRTHLRDYQEAITENTGLLFKAHSSNFGMVGFTKKVSTDELQQLGSETNVPVMYDLGSGCLIDGTPFGWESEKVSEVIRSGLDLVSFSGDKLLGGPQAGILIGKKKIIDRLSRHPLARALRLDKMTLAALETTLRLYLEPEKAVAKIPTLQMLTASENVLKKRAQRLTRKLRAIKTKAFTFEIVPAHSAIGGGALPLTELPTWTIEVRSGEESAQNLALKLRTSRPAIIGRIQQDTLTLDVRTIQDCEINDLVATFRRL